MNYVSRRLQLPQKVDGLPLPKPALYLSQFQCLNCSEICNFNHAMMVHNTEEYLHPFDSKATCL